jgi:hypothetical protein
VDQYSEKWDDKYHRTEGKVFNFIFPFELNLKSDSSRYIDFRFNFPTGYYWLLLSFLLIVAEIIWIRKKGGNIMHQAIDLCLIAVTGIFGFIAVNIFQNKSYK